MLLLGPSHCFVAVPVVADWPASLLSAVVAFACFLVASFVCFAVAFVCLTAVVYINLAAAVLLLAAAVLFLSLPSFFSPR